MLGKLHPVNVTYRNSVFHTATNMGARGNDVFSLKLLYTTVNHLLRLGRPMAPAAIYSATTDFYHNLASHRLHAGGSRLATNRQLCRRLNLANTHNRTRTNCPLIVGRTLPRCLALLSRKLSPRLTLLSALLLLVTVGNSAGITSHNNRKNLH